MVRTERSPFDIFKILTALKLPKNVITDKPEGYDGRLDWKLTEEVHASMVEFRTIVRKRKVDKVAECLKRLGIPDSHMQLRHLTSLILSNNAENLKQALLSCICIGSRPLVEYILFLFDICPEEERSGCENSDAFPPHITPLILACIMNNLAIVECLLLRGHTIEMPHHKDCGCCQCQRVPYRTVFAAQKVDILRAVCSDAYLWLATGDPFAAACSISLDMEQFIEEDTLEYQECYNELLESVHRFATRLIDQNWSEQELDLFLSHKCYCPERHCKLPYPRVQMALDAKLKPFISSTNVQRAMNEAWWKGWGNFGNNMKRDTYRYFRHMICFPVLCILYILSGGSCAKSFDVPLARFITNVSSYVTFLAALISDRCLDNVPDNIRFGLNIYISVYVVGMMMERYTFFFRGGTRGFFSFWWRWFDVILFVCFILAFYLSLILLIDHGYDGVDVNKLHRKHLPEYHPLLLYDICMSVAFLFAFWRLFYYWQMTGSLGSSIISVAKCIPTVSSYVFILATVLSSFAICLNMIINPYQSGMQQESDGKITVMPTSYDSIITTARNLYWAFYGYFDPNNQRIVVGNAGPNYEIEYHRPTALASEFLVGFYYLVIITSLLNLMISLLVKKAEEVLEKEALEFKYTRVVMISEFLHWSTAVPPPFNLLHIPLYLLRRKCGLTCFSKFGALLYCFWLRMRAFCKKNKNCFGEPGDNEIELTVIPPSPRPRDDDENDPHKMRCIRCQMADPNYQLKENATSAEEEAFRNGECDAYMQLVKEVFKRYRAGKEYHFTSIFRTDFNAKEKPPVSNAKVAFMDQDEDLHSFKFTQKKRGKA